MKILLYDSGIGVIPFFFTLCQQHKYHDYILEMEQGFFPLGEKTKEELQDYVRKKCDQWEKDHIDAVYVICNTFSMMYHSLSLPAYSFTVHTILEHNLRLLTPSTSVIATDLTTQYLMERGYKAYPSSFLVRQIEEEDLVSLLSSIRQFSFREKRVLLGCTHFTHIAFLFQKAYPEITFLDGYLSLTKDVPEGTHFSLTLNEKAKKWWKKFGSCHKFSSSFYIDNVRWIL